MKIHLVFPCQICQFPLYSIFSDKFLNYTNISKNLEF